MLSRRITSSNNDHLAPSDAFRTLLQQMIGRRVQSSWAHFEVVAQRGWFQNLWSGGYPWVEVAYETEEVLLLNLGVSKQRLSTVPKIPDSWLPKGKGVWSVPVKDLDELVKWIDNCLRDVSGSASYKVSGWIEGL